MKAGGERCVEVRWVMRGGVLDHVHYLSEKMGATLPQMMGRPEGSRAGTDCTSTKGETAH